MAPIIWLAISLVCSGHTNATCWFNTATFDTREKCAESILVNERAMDGIFSTVETGRKIVPGRSLCLPLAAAPITSDLPPVPGEPPAPKPQTKRQTGSCYGDDRFCGRERQSR